MRIIVTGRKGQVARSLLERGAAAGVEIVLIGRPDLDLAGDARTIASVLRTAEPDAIVSAAAYTAVDNAESDTELAYAINSRGAAAIAETANTLNVPLIHLSTDYVFDGQKEAPYVEGDDTRPTGVYGASKLAGEHQVLASHDNVAILRTAWVYSPFANNFVKTMLRLAFERGQIGVVADQRGNPTSSLDVADGIFSLIANFAANPDPSLRGIFHMVGSGDASWAEFAETIFAISGVMGGPVAKVRPIATVDYPTRATRPANSCLDCGKLALAHGIRLPDWRRSLPEVMTMLGGPTPEFEGKSR